MIPELVCPSLPGGSAVLRADISMAADRPDRLEIEAVDTDPASGLEGRGGDLLRPGHPVEILLEDTPLFAGRVERCALRSDRQGHRWLVVAYSEYERLRSGKMKDTYFQMSDSEIALQIASELGLRPRVELTLEVFARVERRGDPLRFLRQRARQINFQFAVMNGELLFASEVETLPKGPLRLSPGSDLISIEVEDRGLLGRGGCFQATGNPAWRPLREFDVRGCGPAWDSRYHTVRCRHFLGVSGYWCQVDFLEEGTDFAFWEGERDVAHV